MIRVQVFRDGKPLHRIELHKADLIIGRERDADVQLASEAVSRRHARLQRTSEGWQVADLGAANGVYVRRPGQEARRVVIEKIGPEDEIIIETFAIRFEESAERGADVGDTGTAFDDGDSLENKRTLFISMVDVLGSKEAAAARSGAPEAARPAASPTPVPTSSSPAAEPTKSARWWARLVSQQGHDRTFELDDAQVFVGSDASCQIRLPSGPGRLAKLERDGPSVSVTRLLRWPLPRILIEGDSIRSSVLTDGGQMRVGDLEVQIHLRQAPGKS